MRQRIKNAFVFIVLILLAACTGGGGGGGGGSGGGSVVPKTAKAPANVSAVAGDGHITLTWDDVDNAESYNLYWSGQSGVTTANGFLIKDVTSGYTHTGLTNGQRYYYIITAHTVNRESPASDEVSATPLAGTGNDNRVLIESLFSDGNLQNCVGSFASANAGAESWLYADEITGELDCSYRGISDITGIDALTGITAINLGHNVIDDVTLLGQLTNLARLDISFNAITTAGFNADDLAALSGLQSLKLAGNAGIPCDLLTQLLASFDTGVLDIGSAEPGVNCSGKPADTPSDQPNELPDSLPPDIEPQAWPTGVDAIPGDTHITIHWYDAIGATSYNIYWSLTPGVTPATGTVIENVSTGYVHTGLINFTPYYYVVTAIVDGVESQASEEATATPNDVGTLLDALMTDASLQACIDEIITPKGWTFAHELTGSLDCSSRGIQSLSGIENLTALTALNLANNDISDITPLTALTQLRHLFLNNNSLTDATSLSGLTGLTFVNLRNNVVTDVTYLTGLTQLSQLYMNNNLVVDVSPLANLTALTILDVRDNAIGGEGVGHVDALAVLVNATSIRLAGNADINCSELVSLIDAVGTAVVDVSASAGNIDCAGPPGPPQNVAANPGNQRVIVTWEPVIGATTYNLYWGNSAGLDTTTATQIGDVNPGHIHAGLTNETPYYYIVTAVNAAGESMPSEAITATPTLVTLENLFADRNLQACVDEVAIMNNWITADQVTGRLNCSMREISSLEGIEHLTSLSALSLNSNSVIDLMPLSWLTNLTSLSLYRNQITDVTPLRSLVSLTDLYLSDNMIRSVSPLSNLVSLLTLDLSNNQIAGHGMGRIDTLAALSNATDIRLAGNDNVSCSELSALIASKGSVLDVTTVEEGVNCVSPSLVPGGLRAVSGDGQITLSWNPVSGVDQYRLYWSTSAGVDTATASVIDVNGSTHLHAGLANDTNYYYVVSSIDRGNESGPSSEIAAVPSAAGVSLSGLIPDTNLSDCVSAAANSNGWKLAHEITGNVNCSSRGVVDLTGIEYLSALQSIRLGGNNIQDISALSGLTNVTFLDLYNNDISDISALSGLVNLEKLYLHDNNISDISVLSTLSALNYLILDNNNVTDLSPLSGLTSLTKVFARNNGLVDITPLATLTDMTELYINNNNIVDVSSLASLTLSQRLDLRNNSIGGAGVGNIDALINFSNVSQIWLTGNNNVSCAELTVLVEALGISALDVGSAIDGVNCVAP